MNLMKFYDAPELSVIFVLFGLDSMTFGYFRHISEVFGYWCTFGIYMY